MRLKMVMALKRLLVKMLFMLMNWPHMEQLTFDSIHYKYHHMEMLAFVELQLNEEQFKLKT